MEQARAVKGGSKGKAADPPDRAAIAKGAKGGPKGGRSQGRFRLRSRSPVAFSSTTIAETRGMDVWMAKRLLSQARHAIERLALDEAKGYIREVEQFLVEWPEDETDSS